MGFFSKLFGQKQKKESLSFPEGIKNIEDQANEILEAGKKDSLSVDEIMNKIDPISSENISAMTEGLVAKLADDWTCDVCENKNHNTDTCKECGYEAGVWKCPKCGNIITGDDEYGPTETFECECGFNFDD